MEFDSILAIDECRKATDKRRWNVRPLLEGNDDLIPKCQRVCLSKVKCIDKESTNWLARCCRNRFEPEGWVKKPPSSFMFILNKDASIAYIGLVLYTNFYVSYTHTSFNRRLFCIIILLKYI